MLLLLSQSLGVAPRAQQHSVPTFKGLPHFCPSASGLIIIPAMFPALFQLQHLCLCTSYLRKPISASLPVKIMAILLPSSIYQAQYHME